MNEDNKFAISIFIYIPHRRQGVIQEGLMSVTEVRIQGNWWGSGAPILDDLPATVIFSPISAQAARLPYAPINHAVVH